MNGPQGGVDGRPSSRSSFTQYFMQSHIRENIREQDPRAELLKYKDPVFAAGGSGAPTSPALFDVL